MNTRDPLRTRLETDLAAYEAAHGALPGIVAIQRREAFIGQLVDSVRTVEFLSVAQRRGISPNRRNPQSPVFDPVLGAIVCRDAGESDEACWLIFLAIHCGKHLKEEWALARQLYAGDGPGTEWTWARVAANPGAFRQWLDGKNAQWTSLGLRPKFGNHRKYVSLDGLSGRGTGEVVETYVHWVGPAASHRVKIDDAIGRHCGDSGNAFEDLYRSLRSVQQFGRLAKFDYLCMLSKCGLAAIAPGHAYLPESTGPLRGAQLMFRMNGAALDRAAVQLGNALGVGMQVIEDSLCNWEKSPSQYLPFRG